MLFLKSVSKMVGILPNGTLWWCHGEYEWYFMHEPKGSWHNKYLIFIFQMHFNWIFKVLKYLLLLDCISRFFSPTCFDFKSLYRAKLNTSFVFIPLHSDIVFSFSLQFCFHSGTHSSAELQLLSTNLHKHNPVTPELGLSF